MVKARKQKLIMTKKQDAEFKRSKHEQLFAIVKNQNGNYVIIVGQTMMCNREFDTIEQAEKFIESKPYELIFNTCLFLFSNYENVKKETAKSEESSEGSK